MNNVLLVRAELATKYELKYAQQHLPVLMSRSACRDAIVVGRYSVLPYYREVEADLAFNGCKLINTLEEHNWIAGFGYYKHLKEFTAETWDDSNIHLCDHPGPFVVKGKLTSKKRHWQSQMFADNKRHALKIAQALRQDTWIGEQDIIYRKFVPLRTFALGKNGLPFTNEWRFFYLKTRKLCHGYYWTISDCVHLAEMTPAGLALAERVAQIASQHATFFTVDIAETQEGDWILIEINEGQMADLCENDPEEFYTNLRQGLAELATA